MYVRRVMLECQFVQHRDVLQKITLLYITRHNSTAHDTRDHILVIVGLI
jgi:hypothetical protein